MNVVTTRPRGSATLEDLFAIPEGDRHHELIDGEIVARGAGTGEHGAAQCSVGALVGRRFDRRAGGRWPGGWWLVMSVELLFSRRDVLCPDLVAWRRERMPEAPKGTPITLVPDWVCEILSTNRSNDLVKKKRIYHQEHVPHYWILDPVEQMLTVHRWSPDGYIDVLAAQRGEKVRAEPFDAVELPVGAFFGEEEPEE